MRGKSCAELFSWLCLMAKIAALIAHVTGLINLDLTAFLWESCQAYKDTCL
ncbi:uncharacterized protein P174DRAFT_298626 [Aspergillus novofumigatus IBT 16806]|uniref:Uncharacterized protein n=1 Tax=Aspergillus novofumigatus (strain IBT 16806) TaxID=1392255 RepID=A0A2I1BYP9_ASPN1|nr:uncharacterized protein P174DRAFT_298626 [Aspergillus novofumigatus IBT 16806]PKX90503.1 hypothetical protein P174DRAFT_298626 [Aspergillus novofumigatus IBT 16806]